MDGSCVVVGIDQHWARHMKGKQHTVYLGPPTLLGSSIEVRPLPRYDLGCDEG